MRPSPRAPLTPTAPACTTLRSNQPMWGWAEGRRRISIPHSAQALVDSFRGFRQGAPRRAVKETGGPHLAWPLRLGAPGLAFETWESLELNFPAADTEASLAIDVPPCCG